MFRVEKNVPDVYVNESRDFQLFCRLYDLVFQASRFSIDSLEQASDTMSCNDNLLSLLATKVGFFTDLNLTSKADRKILSAFPHIIKYKGSMYGVELVTNLFEQIMNTKVTPIHDTYDRNHVTIVFDDYTPNVDLLYSLLEYIRPTGLLIDFVVRSEIPEVSTSYIVSDNVEVKKVATSDSFVAKDVKDAYESNVGFTQINDNTNNDD